LRTRASEQILRQLHKGGLNNGRLDDISGFIFLEVVNVFVIVLVTSDKGRLRDLGSI